MTERNIVVEEVHRTPIEEQKIEVVERKGIGHPDSLADGIADSISRALCREYLETYGLILHHNTDQVEIVGGKAAPAFGGGKLLHPIYVLLSGRATTAVGEKTIPVNELAIQAAKDYLRSHVKHLDVEKDVLFESRIGQGSVDLTDVFKRKKDIPYANDTSFGVSFAPYSETERIVLETEKLMNSDKFMKRFPASGEDIKVMGLREGERISLTISNAMVSRHIPDLDHYRSLLEEMRSEVEDLASRLTDREVTVEINTADHYESGCVYITVTGTSAEMGDDGSVGRGNRVNGLITPNRFMSMEAAAGKNPVNHVGKLYNLLTYEASREIAETVEGVKEVYMRILSQIGSPIDHPKAASVQLILDGDRDFRQIQKRCVEIVDLHLAEITGITERFIRGELTTF
jgi:S-adenosylmethionine synthetase